MLLQKVSDRCAVWMCINISTKSHLIRRQLAAASTDESGIINWYSDMSGANLQNVQSGCTRCTGNRTIRCDDCIWTDHTHRAFAVTLARVDRLQSMCGQPAMRRFRNGMYITNIVVSYDSNIIWYICRINFSQRLSNQHCDAKLTQIVGKPWLMRRNQRGLSVQHQQVHVRMGGNRRRHLCSRLHRQYADAAPFQCIVQRWDSFGNCCHTNRQLWQIWLVQKAVHSLTPARPKSPDSDC